MDTVNRRAKVTTSCEILDEKLKIPTRQKKRLSREIGGTKQLALIAVFHCGGTWTNSGSQILPRQRQTGGAGRNVNKTAGDVLFPGERLHQPKAPRIATTEF